MAVVLDPSLSDVCRRLNEHRRYSSWLRTRCAAGCGRWPCAPFLRALEEMLRSSWLSQQTGTAAGLAAGPFARPGLAGTPGAARAPGAAATPGGAATPGATGAPGRLGERLGSGAPGSGPRRRRG